MNGFVCIREKDAANCNEIIPEEFAFNIVEETTNISYNNIMIKAFEESEYKAKDSILNYVKSTISKFINECAMEDYYAPYTSVVQSSGTGKSRIFRELSNEWYIHYCCLRPSNSNGYPKDQIVVIIFEYKNASEILLICFHIFILYWMSSAKR